MFIRSVSVENFRNIVSADIELCEGVNVLCGDNAQGKTNMLEAIYYLSGTKSFRGAKDSELIAFGSDTASVTLRAEASGAHPKMLGAVLRRGARHRLYCDGFEIKRAADFLGELTCVIFTPDHLSLVKGSPESRRKFTDLAVCKARPVMLREYGKYAQLLEQKAALLKKYRETGVTDKNVLAVFNEGLAGSAAVIACERAAFVKELCEHAGVFFDEMTSGRERLRFAYESQLTRRDPDYAFDSAESVKKDYMKLFDAGCADELRAAQCLTGTHRDDVGIFVNDRPAREFASQGQQRSAVLAMKLAEGVILAARRRDMPVFLLDDVLSELDAGRQSFVMNRLSGRQVVLTGCNREFFTSLRGANVLSVSAGTYSRA